MFLQSRYKLFSLSGIALSVSLIAGCGGGGGDSAVALPITKTAALIGAQEVTPVTTAATGVGTLTVDPTTLVVSGSATTTGMVGTAAHIHPGATGVNGAPIVTLAETASGSGIWAVPANTVLSTANYALFQAGGLYFNVHSTANAAGQIRGQIGREVKIVAATGNQEAPTAVATSATGIGTLTVDPLTLAISGNITTTGMVGTAAHIHPGATGVNGAPIVTLAETASGSGIWAVPANTVLSAANYALFQAGGLYFNVHSASNPGGQIRGQIGRTVRFATLDGGQEVPTPVTTDAKGSGTLILDPETRAISGSVTTTGMTGTAAHIHPGATGVNGAPIVTLAETASGSGIWAVPANTVLSTANYALFLAGGLYFNVHSATNPGGQVRGQISIQ